MSMRVKSMFPSTGRLARKLVIYVVLASTFITFFTSAFQLYEIYRSDVSSIELRLNEIRDSYVDNIASRVWVANQEELLLTLQGILRLPDIEHIQVFENGDLLAEVGSPPITDSIVREYPLTYVFQKKKKNIGLITISENTALEVKRKK